MTAPAATAPPTPSPSVTWRPDPCRLPLAAVDRVLLVDDDQICVAKAVSASEPYMRGHYPGHPIYPGLFIFETVHQAVGIFADAHRGAASLSELRGARFIAPVRPGDVIECHCRIARVAGRALVTARCRCDERTVATLDLSYRWEEGC